MTFHIEGKNQYIRLYPCAAIYGCFEAAKYSVELGFLDAHHAFSMFSVMKEALK